jgi:hypothetical protein
MRILLAPGLALVTAIALLALAGTARAGTYPMLQCGAAPGRALSGGWSAYGPGGLFDTCGADEAFGVWMGEMRYDTTGGLIIRVPASRPNVAIDKVEASVGVARELDQYAFLRWFAGSAWLFDQEMTGWSQTISRTAPAGARDFTMDVYCSFGGGPVNCRFDDFHRAVSIPWLVFTLSENDDPGAEVTGGSLLADGARSGTQTLNWTATDADSGVKAVAVRLGGSQVAAYDLSPTCAFVDWSPCPLSEARTLDVDTTRLADGTYPLRLDVTDAAGNFRSVDTGYTVTIANRTAGAGAGAERSGQGGAERSAQGGARGVHNGSGAAGEAVLTAELVNRRQAMLVPYRRSAVTISGRLTQRDGTPIAGARLDVGSQTAVSGLPGPDTGSVSTDRDGRWSVTTARGPSREVTVAWRAFERDRSYAETTELSLRVRAGAVLSIHPRRIANGGRVALSGRLLGMPFPDEGVLVTLQGRPRKGGRWRTFGVTRTKPDGRFGYRYRFTRVAGAVRMFLFRARVNRQHGYPYEAGVAGSAKATVRP